MLIGLADLLSVDFTAQQKDDVLQAGLAGRLGEAEQALRALVVANQADDSHGWKALNRLKLTPKIC